MCYVFQCVFMCVLVCVCFHITYTIIVFLTYGASKLQRILKFGVPPSLRVMTFSLQLIVNIYNISLLKLISQNNSTNMLMT